MTMDVDIAIPAHNADATIERAVRSALRSVDPEHIHVFCDNCTDGTEAIARRLGVNVASGTAGSAASARNRAAAMGEAPYIAFLDADDAFVHTWPAAAYEVIESNSDAGAVFTNALRIDEQGRRRPLGRPVPHGVTVAQILVRNPFCTSAVVVRRDLFAAVGGFNEQLIAAEDYDLWLRLAARADIVQVPGVHVHIHYTPASLTRGAVPQLLRFRADCLSVIDAAVERHPELQSEADQARANTYTDSALRLLAAGAPHPARKELLSALRKSPRYRRAWKIAPVTLLPAPALRALRHVRATLLNRLPSATGRTR